ncbi:MAG TPA: hypothetical protein VMU34_11550 [Mycobacterium sp.]|nr:hypothetical protein [Mycobacterium sp.]
MVLLIQRRVSVLQFPMTPELRERISALSPAPPPATDLTETLTGGWT